MTLGPPAYPVSCSRSATISEHVLGATLDRYIGHGSWIVAALDSTPRAPPQQCTPIDRFFVVVPTPPILRQSPTARWLLAPRRIARACPRPRQIPLPPPPPPPPPVLHFAAVAIAVVAFRAAVHLVGATAERCRLPIECTGRGRAVQATAVAVKRGHSCWPTCPAARDRRSNSRPPPTCGTTLTLQRAPPCRAPSRLLPSLLLPS